MLSVSVPRGSLLARAAISRAAGRFFLSTGGEPERVEGAAEPHAAPTVDFDPAQQYSTASLKSMLKTLHLKSSGSKSELIGRLQAWRLSKHAFARTDAATAVASPTEAGLGGILLQEALPESAPAPPVVPSSVRSESGNAAPSERLPRWSSRHQRRTPVDPASPPTPPKTVMPEAGLDDLFHDAIPGDFSRSGTRSPGHQSLRDRVYELVTEIRNAQDALTLSGQFAELLQLSMQLNELRGRIDFPKSHFMYFALQRACALNQIEMAFAMLLQIKLLSPQAYVRIVDLFAFEALLEGCWKQGAVDYFVGLLERMRIEGVPMQKRTFELAFEGLIEYNQVAALQLHWTLYRAQVREYAQLAVHPRLERRVQQKLQGILPPIRPPPQRRR